MRENNERSMKQNAIQEQANRKDDFWAEHVRFFTGQLPSYCTKPQLIWADSTQVRKGTLQGLMRLSR